MPDFIKSVGKQAIDDGLNGYGPTEGVPAIREAFVNFLKRKYALDYDSTQILTTTGESQGLAAVMQALINENDGVIIPTPAFPQYELCTLINKGQPIFIDTSQNNFKLTPKMIEQAKTNHPNAKLIILNYPSNPTGVTYSSEELRAFAQVIEALDLFVISDEIYSELTYTTTHHSIANFIPERTILLNGASKTFAMTGWRIGFIACPKHLYGSILKSHQSSTPVGQIFTQLAGAAAFNMGDNTILEMKSAYNERRNYIVKALEDLNFTVTHPDGAFYVFPKLPNFVTLDDKTFALQLAEQFKVGVIPGSVFGIGGENHLRISYATSLDTIKIAMSRIEQFLNTLK